MLSTSGESEHRRLVTIINAKGGGKERSHSLTELLV